MKWLRLLALAVLLNVLRYVLGFAVEPVLIFDGLFGAMEASLE